MDASLLFLTICLVSVLIIPPEIELERLRHNVRSPQLVGYPLLHHASSDIHEVVEVRTANSMRFSPLLEHRNARRPQTLALCDTKVSSSSSRADTLSWRSLSSSSSSFCAHLPSMVGEKSIFRFFVEPGYERPCRIHDLFPQNFPLGIVFSKMTTSQDSIT